MAGEHFVGHDGEGVDVAAFVQRLARELLRAHVGRRAEYHALLSELRFARGVRRFGAGGNAEVEQLDDVLFTGPLDEDHILRLQVPMNDALLVRLRERAGDLTKQAQHPFWS